MMFLKPDGKIDLAIASQVLNQQTGVHLVLGNGDGTFQTAPVYKTGQYPQTIATPAKMLFPRILTRVVERNLARGTRISGRDL